MLLLPLLESTCLVWPYCGARSEQQIKNNRRGQNRSGRRGGIALASKDMQ